MFFNIIIGKVEFVQELERAKFHGFCDSHSSSAFFKFNVNICPFINGQLEEKISPIVARIIEVKL